MSLGIAFKGTEGIVLAADSRVTLTTNRQQPNGHILLVQSTFDNATKLLKVKGHDYVGAVTYGIGALGQTAPRTAHSFLSEFEARLAINGSGRLTVKDFAKQLSDFFMEQWKLLQGDAAAQPKMDMVFLVGGYDEGDPYGRVFDFFIPSRPDPTEQYDGSGQFGAVWGGQREYVDRLIQGYDPRVLDIVSAECALDEPRRNKLRERLGQLQTPIPFAFLPLQDCVDLSIFLVRTTMSIQTWTVGMRGVGGAIDVATITKTEGFRAIQIKQLSGEASTKYD